jgi:hypothetical protein
MSNYNTDDDSDRGMRRISYLKAQAGNPVDGPSLLGSATTTEAETVVTATTNTATTTTTPINNEHTAKGYHILLLLLLQQEKLKKITKNLWPLLFIKKKLLVLFPPRLNQIDFRVLNHSPPLPLLKIKKGKRCRRVHYRKWLGEFLLLLLLLDWFCWWSILLFSSTSWAVVKVETNLTMMVSAMDRVQPPVGMISRLRQYFEDKSRPPPPPPHPRIAAATTTTNATPTPLSSTSTLASKAAAASAHPPPLAPSR